MNTKNNFLNNGFSSLKRFYLDLYVYNFYHISNVFKWNIAIRRAVGFWFLFSKLLIVLCFIQPLRLKIPIVIFFFVVFLIIDFLYLDDKVSEENVEQLYEQLENKNLVRIFSLLILTISIYSLCTVVL